MCKYYPYGSRPNGTVQDSKGNTPYHLVMERKRSPNTIKICEILSGYPINPSLFNKLGKRPGDGKSKQEKRDRRNLIMQDAAKQFQPKKRSGKKRRNRTASSSEACSPDASSSADVSTSTSVGESSTSQQQIERTLDIDDIIRDVNIMLTQLSDEPEPYFEPPPTYARQRSKKNVPETNEIESVPSKQQKKPLPLVNESKQATEKDAGKTSDLLKFETSTWEVECTEKVKKFFGNAKIPKHEKEMVVETIKKLINGIPMHNQNLYKEVRSGVKLFEAHYSKGSRINL